MMNVCKVQQRKILSNALKFMSYFWGVLNCTFSAYPLNLIETAIKAWKMEWQTTTTSPKTRDTNLFFLSFHRSLYVTTTFSTFSYKFLTETWTEMIFFYIKPLIRIDFVLFCFFNFPLNSIPLFWIGVQSMVIFYNIQLK